jgi:hypothetical protein
MIRKAFHVDSYQIQQQSEEWSLKKQQGKKSCDCPNHTDSALSG